MSTQVWLGTIAVVCGLLVVTVLRRCDEEGRWGWPSLVVFSVAWLCNAGPVIGTLLGGRQETFDTFGEPVVYYSGLAATITKFAPYTLLTLGLLCWLAIGRGKVSLAVPGLQLLLTWALVVVVTFAGPTGSSSALSLAVTGVLIAAGLTLGLSADKVATGVTVFALCFAGLSAAAGTVAVANVARACREDKCGPLGFLYTGLQANENAFALTLACALPFVLIATSGRVRLAVLIVLSLSIWISGSRSALIVAAAQACVLGLLHLRNRQHTVAVMLGAALVTGGLVASALVPLVTRDDDAFSGRGLVWRIASHEIAESPLVGFGADAWNSLSDRGVVPWAAGYSAHNLWVDHLYMSGVLGTLLLAWALWRIHARVVDYVAVPLLVSIIYGSLGERVLTFGQVNWLSWFMLAVTCFVAAPKYLKAAPEDLPALTYGARARRSRG